MGIRSISSPGEGPDFKGLPKQKKKKVGRRLPRPSGVSQESKGLDDGRDVVPMVSSASVGAVSSTHGVAKGTFRRKGDDEEAHHDEPESPPDESGSRASDGSHADDEEHGESLAEGEGSVIAEEEVEVVEVVDVPDAAEAEVVEVVEVVELPDAAEAEVVEGPVIAEEEVEVVEVVDVPDTAEAEVVEVVEVVELPDAAEAEVVEGPVIAEEEAEVVEVVDVPDTAEAEVVEVVDAPVESISYGETKDALLDKIRQLKELSPRAKDFQLAQILAGFDTNIGGRYCNVSPIRTCTGDVQHSFANLVDLIRGRRYIVIVQVDESGQSKYNIIYNTNPDSAEYSLESYDEKSKTFCEFTEHTYRLFHLTTQDRVVLSNRELPAVVSTYHGEETPNERVGGYYYHERKRETSGVYGLHAANAFWGSHAITFSFLSNRYKEHLERLGQGEDSVVVLSGDDDQLVDVREGNNPQLLFETMTDYCTGLEEGPYSFHHLAFNKINIAQSGSVSVPSSLLDERVDRILAGVGGKFFTFRKEVIGDKVSWFLIDSTSEKQEEVNPLEYLHSQYAGQDISLIYPEFEEVEATTVSINLSKVDRDPLSGNPLVSKSDVRTYDMDQLEDFSELLLSFSSAHSQELLRKVERGRKMTDAIAHYEDLRSIDGREVEKELQGSCWGFGSIENLRQHLMSNTPEFQRLPANIVNFLKVLFVGSRSWRERHSEENTIIAAIGWDEEIQHRKEVGRTKEVFAEMLVVDKRTIELEHKLVDNQLIALRGEVDDLPDFIMTGRQLPLLLGTRIETLQYLFEIFRIVHSGKKSQLLAFLDGLSDIGMTKEMHKFISCLLAESNGNLGAMRRRYPLNREGIDALVAKYKQNSMQVITSTQHLVASLPEGKTFMGRRDMLLHFYQEAQREDISTSDNPIVRESKSIVSIIDQYVVSPNKERFLASLPAKHSDIIRMIQDHRVLTPESWERFALGAFPDDVEKGKVLGVIEYMRVNGYSDGDFTSPLGRLDWYSELISKNNFLFHHSPESETWEAFIRGEDEDLFMLNGLVFSDHSVFMRGHKGILNPASFRALFSKYKKALVDRSRFLEQQINAVYSVPETEIIDMYRRSNFSSRGSRFRIRMKVYAKRIFADIQRTVQARNMVASKLSTMVFLGEERCDQMRAAEDYLETLGEEINIQAIVETEDTPALIKQAGQLVMAARQPSGNPLEMSMDAEHRKIIGFLRQVAEKYKYYMDDFGFQDSLPFLQMAFAELNSQVVMQQISECDLRDISVGQLMELEKIIDEAFDFTESFSDYYFFKQIDMFKTRFRLALQEKSYDAIKQQLMDQMGHLTKPGASVSRQVSASVGVGFGVNLDLNLSLSHLISRGDTTVIDIKVGKKAGLSLSLSGDLPGIADATGKIYADALFKTGERFPTIEDFVDELAKRSSIMVYSFMTLGVGTVKGIRAKRTLVRSQKKLRQLQRKARTQHDLFAATVSDVFGVDSKVVVLPPKVGRGRKMLFSSRGHEVGGKVSGSLLGDTLSASLALSRTSMTTRVRKEIDFLTTLKRFPMLLDKHPDIRYLGSGETVEFSTIFPTGYRKKRQKLCLNCNIYSQKVRDFLRNNDVIDVLQDKIRLLQQACEFLEDDPIVAHDEPLDLTRADIDLITGQQHPTKKQLRWRQGFLLLQSELDSLGIHGKTQQEVLDIAYKIIRREENILSRKNAHKKSLIVTLKSMEKELGVDRKALIRAYNREVPKKNRLALKSVSMRDKEMFIVLEEYLRKNRNSFEMLETVVQNLLDGKCDEGDRGLFEEIREEIPSPPERGRVISREYIDVLCDSPQWMKVSRRLLRHQIEENFGRWQHYSFVVNQYEVIPHQVEKLQEELAVLNRQKRGLDSSSSRYRILQSQIVKIEHTIVILRDRVPVLRGLKHKIEKSFSDSSGRVAMLRKTILSHLYMLRDYRMFCSSDEEFDNFVAELQSLELEYTSPNIYLTGSQQRDLMIAGEFEGYSSVKELAGEVSLFGSQIQLKAQQVEISRDANIDNEGEYRNFSATIVVDPRFVPGIVDALTRVDVALDGGMNASSLSDAMKSVSEHVQGTISDIITDADKFGVGVAVKLEWNLVKSGDKYIVQYARATRAMELSLSKKGSISGVGVGGKYSQGSSRYIKERTGDNTLTYLKTVYNGFKTGYYERMRSKFHDLWDGFTQEHLSEICSIFVKLATEPDSVVREEWNADVESLRDALGEGFVERFEAYMRYIRDNELTADDLKKEEYEYIRLALQEAMNTLFLVNNAAIPVGISDTVSLPGLRDWIIDAGSVLS